MADEVKVNFLSDWTGLLPAGVLTEYSHFSPTMVKHRILCLFTGVSMKLLVVEDEKRMAELLHKGLTEEGHTVACATDGNGGLELAANYDFDVIILDVMMPKLNGFELAKRLRSEKIATPVLMLTAKDTVQDVVHGLDVGADDYMTKPFSFNELLARLRAVKRRAHVPQPIRLEVGDLVVDPATREVCRSGMRISLTRTEYSLLEQLIYRAGTVVRRQFLIEAVWGFDRDIEDNTLDVFVRLLRFKIQDDTRQKLIHTVRGVGYILRAEPFR
ncbi:MAG TPA: response regulator transcription factor [Terriglobales bacterium]|jgi:DNA-binding response OmpR family regulator|nr:response regulator transcription factor [Terriglobales bacterium]